MTDDLLLRNARLVGRDGEPTDVLIEDGAVSAIASGIAAGTAEAVDLEGRFLQPGLWDNHVHMEQWALVRQRLDVSGAASAREAAALVQARLASEVPGDRDLLVGYGFQDALWNDEPTRALLDGAGASPIVLVSHDLHAVWANTAGLALVGLPGHPTGLLREQEAFDASTTITGIDSSRIDEWVGDAARAAAARGVVGIVDLEMTLSFEAWARRVSQGVDSLRVRAGVYPRDLDAVIGSGLRTGDEIGGCAGLVTVGPAKIITDGSLNTRTAFCHDPYPGLAGRPGANGVSVFIRAELVELMTRASSAGFDLAVHAIGDRANTDVLDAYETIGARGSIEHAQLLTTADVARFARLGVVASVQPEHAMDDRDVAEVYWEGRTGRAFPLESLAAAGVVLRLGSDAPVAPLDPWIALDAAVTRSRGGRDPWHPEQRLARAVALAASTGGSGPSRSGAGAGSVGVALGDRADLAVVDADPLAETTSLRSMSVAATLLAGRFTHRAL
ncbi:amidohydrolase [Frondihabitans cladoniiphilus]|uniref:Amidohydrolase family protein n=1 Tax=Frondihabitans cladoniiphilus TaxID=715785 RepID=A0ABP8VRR8_9MICO